MKTFFKAFKFDLLIEGIFFRVKNGDKNRIRGGIYTDAQFSGAFRNFFLMIEIFNTFVMSR